MRGKACTCCYACPLHTDHPRTCGEKRLKRHTREWLLGSPPHMRGKAERSSCNDHQPRITPAHAGKRRSMLEQMGYNTDHPRTCGEKCHPFLRQCRNGGSPPHMRGKEVDTFRFSRGYGITPAHAGKRTSSGKHRLTRRDHPRTCGEKL